MSVTAHLGPHANLFQDPHGCRLPPVPDGGDREFSHCVFGERGPNFNGIDGALYPRGFAIGLSYSPMTYLWGEQTDGEVATHEQLRPIAEKLFGESCKPVWLYKGMAKGRTTWYAAYRAHHVGVDPCRHHEYPAGAAGKYLTERLMKILGEGSEALDMGFIYGAEVYLPEPKIVKELS